MFEKIQISLKFHNNNGTLHEDRYTFMVMPCLILLRMRNVSEKKLKYRENQSTHFMSGYFFSENGAICEIIWKNVVQPDMPQMALQYRA